MSGKPGAGGPPQREPTVHALLRRIDPGERSPAELGFLLARVKGQIARRQRSASATLVLRLAITCLVLGVTGAGVAAWLARDPGVPAEVAPKVMSPPPVEVAPAPPPVKVEEPAAKPVRRPARRPEPSKAAVVVREEPRSTASVESSAPLAPDRALLEARMLKEAIGALRSGDARGALARIDERERTFGAGLLEQEAAVVRVEALVTLGRSSEALARVEALALDGHPRRDELQLIRGELRASGNRCQVAARDFDELLARPIGRPLEERARYGRAVCLAREGRQEAARAAFSDYLQRFPEGRFASQARAAVAR